ncbi:MAG: hypothetical protein RPS47_12110, partial [Colwellia sp.]
PTDMQSYNRYAYVRNNPLAYTDPTGYSWVSSGLDWVGSSIQYETNHFYESVWKKHGMTILQTAGAVYVCSGGPASCAMYFAVVEATKATMNTPAGQRAVRKFAGVLEKMGVDEKHSNAISAFAISYAISSAYSAGLEYAVSGEAGTVGAEEAAAEQAGPESVESEKGGAPDTQGVSKGYRKINPDVDGDGIDDITFINDNGSGVSTNMPVRNELAGMVEDTVRETGLDININSTNRTLLPGGDASNHHFQNAVDINRINGLRVDNPAVLSNATKLQDAFQAHPGIRENFGPAYNLKKVGSRIVDRSTSAKIVRLHRNHIHASGAW